MLIAAVRTPLKKFHTKKIPPGKKAPRKEADIDLEDEFISTPPPVDIETGKVYSYLFCCRIC